MTYRPFAATCLCAAVVLSGAAFAQDDGSGGGGGGSGGQQSQGSGPTVDLPLLGEVPIPGFLADLFGIEAEGGGGQGQGQAQQGPPAVIFTVAEVQPVAETFRFLGRIEPIEQVAVQTRVPGFIERVAFEGGQQVAEGDVLFQIETDQYDAALQAARATEESARAQFTTAERNLARSRDLRESGTVAQASLDDTVAAYEAARGDLLRAEAEVRQAELELDYTTIRAPIDGRISQPYQTRGNFVSSATGEIAELTQIDPVWGVFALGENRLIEWQRLGIGGADVAPIVRESGADGQSGGSGGGESGGQPGGGGEGGQSSGGGEGGGGEGGQSSGESGGEGDQPTRSDQGGQASQSGEDQQAGETEEGAEDGAQGDQGPETGGTSTGDGTGEAAEAAPAEGGGDQAAGSGETRDPPGADPLPEAQGIDQDVSAALASRGDGDGTEGEVSAGDYDLRLTLPDGSNYADAGRLSFIGNSVDPQTGTVEVRVEFANPGGLLLPNQNVTLIVTEADPPEYPVVPQAAVLLGRDGRTVWIVRDDDTVSRVPVEVMAVAAPGQVAVTRGLGGGERVIVRGTMALEDGATVDPRMASGNDGAPGMGGQ